MSRANSILALFAAVLAAGLCFAEFAIPRTARPSKWIRIEEGAVIDEENVRTARETSSHSMETPVWTNAPGFERDVFTFARAIFQNDPNADRRRFGPQLGWWVDYPDADLNLAWRLQQLTSIRTDPDCRVVKLTDPEIFDFPLLYMEHAGYMLLTEEEAGALRAYLERGGSLLVNDFWSGREWDGFAAQIERVLPNRAWTELDTEHPVFSCVYDLRRPMHELRVPTMQFWNEEFDAADPLSPPHRIFRGEGSEEMHVRALADERGRIVILAIHNSDVSDGWEREGEDDAYFNRYSEKVAYPLAVNMVFYLMTH